jgi:hypothetical protein
LTISFVDQACFNPVNRAIQHVSSDGAPLMQTLKTLFASTETQAADVPAQQPVELSAESLKLVGGGLPRVGGFGGSSGLVAPDTDSAASLPSAD